MNDIVEYNPLYRKLIIINLIFSAKKNTNFQKGLLLKKKFQLTWDELDMNSTLLNSAIVVFWKKTGISFTMSPLFDLSQNSLKVSFCY